MANSSTVAALDDILATQYNTLRSDVLDTSTGHTHNGSDGKVLTKDSLTNRTRNRFLPIQGATAQTGSPAYAVQGTNLRYAAWAFDAAAVERLCFDFLMPEDAASGNITVKLYWTNLGAGAGNVVWRIFGLPVADGADLNGTAGAADASNTIAAPAQNILKVSSHTVSIGVSTNLYAIVVGREGSDAADTLANDAGLVAIEIEYTADM